MAVFLNYDIFIARAELFTLAPMIKTLSYNDIIYPTEATLGSMRKSTTQCNSAVRQGLKLATSLNWTTVLHVLFPLKNTVDKYMLIQ